MASVSHLALTHLGLDVHKDTISVAILTHDRDVPFRRILAWAAVTAAAVAVANVAVDRFALRHQPPDNA